MAHARIFLKRWHFGLKALLEGVYSLGFRVSGLGFLSGLGFRVSGLGFRVSGFGFRVLGFRGFMVHIGLAIIAHSTPLWSLWSHTTITPQNPILIIQAPMLWCLWRVCRGFT